jgi:RNA polymerase sigma-70 factor, ECF subfamily
LKTSTAEIETLYRTYGPAVYRRCLRLLGNASDAEDATQVVFIQLLKNRDRFRDSAHVVPWIFEVTQNHCRNQRRNAGRQHQQLDQAAQWAPIVAEHQAADTLAARTLSQGLKGEHHPLTEAVTREVLVNEKTHAETAAALHVSTKTVQRTLQRFLNRARKLLKLEP